MCHAIFIVLKEDFQTYSSIFNTFPKVYCSLPGSLQYHLRTVGCAIELELFQEYYRTEAIDVAYYLTRMTLNYH